MDKVACGLGLMTQLGITVTGLDIRSAQQNPPIELVKTVLDSVTVGGAVTQEQQVELRPVCLIPPTAPSDKLPTVASGNDILLMKKHSLTTMSTAFQFWWSQESNMKGSRGSSPGFQITWHAEKRRNTENQKYELGDQELQKQRGNFWSSLKPKKPGPKNAKWRMVKLA